MNYSFKTISKKVMGDLHTPVSIYLKVRDIYPESALLESSDFHGNENSLSFIALRPLASIGINNGECTATFPDETREVTPLTEDYNVPEAMNAFLGRFKVEGADKKVCGLFGYTAFDAVRYFENIPVMEVHHEENDAPDMLYILYKYILVFNHFKNELTLVEMLQEDEASRLEEIETLIENRNFASYNFQTAGPETSPITGEEYKAMVRQGIKHCLRGDVFQIVLSRRFEQPFKGDDFKVYRLRSLRARSTSITCSAFSLGSASRASVRCLSTSILPVRKAVPAIGSMLACLPVTLQCVSGEEPKIRKPPKSK